MHDVNIDNVEEHNQGCNIRAALLHANQGGFQKGSQTIAARSVQVIFRRLLGKLQQ